MSLTLTKSVPLNVDSICLQKGLAFLTGGETVDQIAYASTVQSKLMQYGYMLDAAAFDHLRKSTPDDIIEYHNNVIDFLKDITGGKESFLPLYGDFPLSIMQEDETMAVWNAMNYYSMKSTMEGFVSSTKSVQFENVKYTTLKLATNTMVSDIFTSLVSINQSLTPLDLEIVKWFVSSKYTLIFPETIPFKENLCTLAAIGVPGLPINTPTDVLRIAVYMSGGDISLPAVPKLMKPVAKSPWKTRGTLELNTGREKFKFKKWTRAERKYLLGLLESTHCDPREMVLRDQRWIRLAHGLHSGEYGKLFPRAITAIHVLRNGKVKSWYAKLEIAFKSSLTAGLNILGERPGEFVRRISWLLTKFNNITQIAEITQRFKIVTAGASNKVMYELYNYLEKRREDTTERYIMIKGARKKTKLPGQKALESTHIDLIQGVLRDGLVYKFRKLEPLGKTWIDPELKKIPLPTNMRSLNVSLKPQVRGQRTPIGNKDAKVIRPFFHWIDIKGALDPDLSATFVKVGQSDVLSYSHLRIGRSCHSGDIIGRKGACAEYIDIDVADAKQMGYKYVVMDVRNFRGGTLAEMQGVFGIMERKHPESNNTWLPDTVAGCQLMNSTTSTTLCAIIDLDTMEYIFLDVDSGGTTYARGDVKGILEVINQYAVLPKFSVHSLLEMHVEVRGELVDKPEDADKKFEFEEFCHDYTKTAVLMGI